MDFSNLSFFKIEADTIIKPFDCGDTDLNDFLFKKAKLYGLELMSTTFVIEDSEKTYAYYSIFNDSLRVQENNFASKNAFKRFLKSLVSHPKRHFEYFPAIKIGRLAVNKNIENSGTGRTIVNYIIDFAIEQNTKCACKLITVDAYSNSLGFYEKMGFEYFSDKDEGKDTSQMFLDITPYVKAKI